MDLCSDMTFWTLVASRCSSNKSDRNKEKQYAWECTYPAPSTYPEDTEKSNVWIKLLCCSHILDIHNSLYCSNILDILSLFIDSVPHHFTTGIYPWLRGVASEKDAFWFQWVCLGIPPAAGRMIWLVFLPAVWLLLCNFSYIFVSATNKSRQYPIQHRY